MRTLFIVVLLFLSSCSFAQHKITEKKDEKGQLIEYAVETERIGASMFHHHFRLFFVWSAVDRKHYLKVVTPEDCYRRININDSVLLVFEDGSTFTRPVVKNQKGYMLTEKLEWLAFQFYLTFIIDLDNELLEKLQLNKLSGIYLQCKGYPDVMLSDYASLSYPISNSDKKRFQRKAELDITFKRTNINERGHRSIQSAAESFSKYIKSLSP